MNGAWTAPETIRRMRDFALNREAYNLVRLCEKALMGNAQALSDFCDKTEGTFMFAARENRL